MRILLQREQQAEQERLRTIIERALHLGTINKDIDKNIDLGYVEHISHEIQSFREVLLCCRNKIQSTVHGKLFSFEVDLFREKRPFHSTYHLYEPVYLSINRQVNHSILEALYRRTAVEFYKTLLHREDFEEQHDCESKSLRWADEDWTILSYWRRLEK